MSATDGNRHAPTCPYSSREAARGDAWADCNCNEDVPTSQPEPAPSAPSVEEEAIIDTVLAGDRLNWCDWENALAGALTMARNLIRRQKATIADKYREIAELEDGNAVLASDLEEIKRAGYLSQEVAADCIMQMSVLPRPAIFPIPADPAAAAEMGISAEGAPEK